MLASNTSSISITALANGLKRPGRLVGMHFFNPVPLMKLVEVVSGLQTDADVAAAIFELSKRWGKTPVHARSTPGFIVNRIARPYYAEALSLLHERFAEPATIDACLRGAGFRMGPCELMDLIGHDTNFAVTQSVFDANFGDKRYVPSLRPARDGRRRPARPQVGPRLLRLRRGRRGDAAPAATFDGARRSRPARSSRCTAAASPSTAGRRGSRRPSVRFEADPSSRWNGLQTDTGELRLGDGRAAMQVAADSGVRDLAVFDLAIAPAGGAPGTALALAFAASASAEWREQAAGVAAHRRLATAGRRRRARPGRRAHGRHADQRRRRCRPAGRLHARKAPTWR